jgi:hypothetical protein
VPRKLKDADEATREKRKPLTPEYRDELEAGMLQTLRAVERGIDALCSALGQATKATVVVRTDEGSDATMEHVCTTISNVTIPPDDARGTASLIGVVGVPTYVVRLAEEVNAAKARMKACWSTAQRYTTAQPKRDAPGATETVSLARLLLRRIGRTDLSLNAAYRKIPVLERAPTRVVFHLAMTRNIYKVRRATLERLLAESQSEGKQADLARLAACPEVQYAALVSKRYPNHRANVWFPGLDTAGRGRIQTRAELPILYPLGRKTDAPEVVFPKVRPGAPRRTRVDTKVDEVPFLRSIGAHLYKQKKRAKASAASPPPAHAAGRD